MSDPVTVLVVYRPKAGTEEQFAPLLAKHWPALQQLGLVTAQAPQFWRGSDKRKNQSVFVELFQWRDAEAPGIAHQTPEVMAIWEPMGPILEDMSILHVDPWTPQQS
jgi:quinol monooxygenase YgiN